MVFFASLYKRMVRFHPSPTILSSLCFSSSPEWILPGLDVQPKHFQERTKQAGVSRIAFLRHGRTAPAVDGVDFNRLLTEEGRLQSKQAGKKFGSNLKPYFPKVLVSPAPRTVETATLFLKAAGAEACSGDVGTVELTPVQSIYDGTMIPEGSRLFQKLGYAPLRAYVDNSESQQDRQVARRVLGDYTTLAAIEILKHLQPTVTKSSSDSCTLLVVAHAIYLPAAALGVAVLCDCAPQFQDILLDTNTQEAEGYLIHADQSTVEKLTS